MSEQVTIRYMNERGAGCIESIRPAMLCGRLGALCKRRLAAKAEDSGGWVGEVWKNDEGRWCWVAGAETEAVKP